VLFLIVLPGTCALLLFPKLPRADMVYPKLILNLLPPGLVGLVVAGFVAATMVSIASMLNSASTLLTIDVIRQFKPGLSNSSLVRAGRWTTAGLLVVAVAWAPQLNLFPSLWQYLQGVLAYAVPPVVAVFLAGMFWRGANADGAVAAMIAGSICGFIFFLLNGVLGWTHIRLSARRAAETCTRSLLAGLPGAGSRAARADGGSRHRVQMTQILRRSGVF
jgi:SSS family solute:Na+ symporter